MGPCSPATCASRDPLGRFMPNSSELHETLQANGIDTVIVTGVASDACVETTAREAVMLDYKTIFVMDATATDTDEHHNAAIATLNHIFLPDLVMTDLLVRELERSPILATVEG
ncbi:MAG: Isochorismatase family protein YecD [Nitrospira sp. OLB3]|nr:MAG: Isochorismatase family protein YecD [Nitrospira sp. OLB3]